MSDCQEYQRKYYLAHREQRCADQRAYYARNRKAELKKQQTRRKINAKKLRALQKARHKANPLRRMLYSAKARAKVLNVAFNLTPENVVMPSTCPVLGIPIICSGDFVRPNSPTLDRIDGKIGYVVGNVRIISWRANRLKSDGTVSEFKCIIAYMNGAI